MMDQFSSLPGGRPPAARSLTGEWRDYAAFLRRPWVPDRATGPNARSLLATLRLLLLDYALMAVLMGIGGLALLGGFEFPDNALESLEWSGATLALVILLAPIGEEVMFRGWLSGRLGHVLAVLVLIVGGIAQSAVVTATALDGTAGTPVAGQLVLPVAIIVALALLYLLRRREVMPWFARTFPVLFWLSALAFATIHIWNYEEAPGPLLFALVIPQLIAGTIFGYARVRYGLWSAILLHILHNGTAVSLALLTSGMMGG